MKEALERFVNRINLLSEGRTLLLNHGVYGIFKIAMNPQRNRIFIKDKVNVSKTWYDMYTNNPDCLAEEHAIISLLFWNSGEWYVLEKKEEVKPKESSAWEKILEKYEVTKV